MRTHVYLNDLGILNAQAEGKAAVMQEILSGRRSGFTSREIDGTSYPVAMCSRYLQDPGYLKTNRLIYFLSKACEQIRPSVEAQIQKYGRKRIGVILGSTDNGSEQALHALKVFYENGAYPKGYQLEKQQAHYPVDFVKNYFGLESVATSISTACTSSAGAIILAHKLLQAGIVDAVIAGGADVVSDSVLKGFISLGAVDTNLNNPFSKNRHGINLGEGAALFIISKEPVLDHPVRLAGYGESSDAHHMTAPDPKGAGAQTAMKKALSDSGLRTVDYINLHGTGTDLNDAMESWATCRVFPEMPITSSSKPMVGHTLGAAGAMELGFCWLVLSKYNKNKRLPPHVWDGDSDAALPTMNFALDSNSNNRIDSCMSNSFAFGGCNVSIIIDRGASN